MTNKKIVYKPVDHEIAELAHHHGGTQEATLEVLKDLGAKNKLNPVTITEAARALHIPAHEAYGMATFYSMLSLEERKKVLRVCDGPVCWLKRATADGGRQTVVDEWSSMVNGQWSVERSSCLGLCDRAPAVLVEDEQAGPVSPKDAKKVCEGWRGVPTEYSKPRKGEVRVMTSLIGKVDPDEIDSALEHGLYDGLKKALQSDPTTVLAEVESSGLQGRGGAGFPVGRKWRFVASEKRTPRYIVCNADESEPLIFKDRVLMETNPHQLLEGIVIAGYACGASEAWIYIRGEYEHQARRLERAIDQAKAKNLLGKNILGSGFSFDIHVHRGAGAYICGEETALLESLEGKRGEPRLRPPYPPTSGFRGQPTAVNNVESFCAVPHILKNGAEWWKSISTYSVPGTKMYMVLGHVNHPGLFEAPFGLTLRQIIDDFGGGMIKGSKFKFALCGGAAGTIVDEKLLDIPIDFASSQKGISLGAGSFLVCDESVSPVAFLRELLHFFAVESCGKCTPCRVGTWRSLEILNRMASGKGQQGDVEELTTLASLMHDSSFCGLGQSVPIPMKSVLTHFEAEFKKAEN
ncbi:MAG: NADH-quinone oxidoreductase subunit NuoF [Chloroflexi bacterium]|nr:NADH-quinone oxidoreductase subunit NuoF [Chloroflexota bacterium]